MLFEFVRGGITSFEFLAFVIAALVAITVHEFAHAVRATQAGDPTPGRQGRLTLNPVAHYDPIGTTMILVVGMGWGRAVWTDPATYRHPRRDGLMISLWGPLSNLLLAITVLLVLRFIPIPWRPWPQLAFALVQWNLFLAFFNLLPIGPLDGATVMTHLLPDKLAVQFQQFMAQYGMMMLFLLVFAGAGFVGSWIGVPSSFIIETALRGWHPPV